MRREWREVGSHTKRIGRKKERERMKVRKRKMRERKEEGGEEEKEERRRGGEDGRMEFKLRREEEGERGMEGSNGSSGDRRGGQEEEEGTASFPSQLEKSTFSIASWPGNEAREGMVIEGRERWWTSERLIKRERGVGRGTAYENSVQQCCNRGVTGHPQSHQVTTQLPVRTRN